MLTSKQKSFLRSKAHKLQPVIQVGKSIVTETVIDTVVKALQKRELIKISVLQNCLAEPKEVASIIVQHADAQLVQVIGRVIILYKKSSNQAFRTITHQIPK